MFKIYICFFHSSGTVCTPLPPASPAGRSSVGPWRGGSTWGSPAGPPTSCSISSRMATSCIITKANRKKCQACRCHIRYQCTSVQVCQVQENGDDPHRAGPTRPHGAVPGHLVQGGPSKGAGQDLSHPCGELAGGAGLRAQPPLLPRSLLDARP